MKSAKLKVLPVGLHISTDLMARKMKNKKYIQTPSHPVFVCVIYHYRATVACSFFSAVSSLCLFALGFSISRTPANQHNGLQCHADC